VDASNDPQTVLVDSVSAAHAVARPESTIRGWAHQGKLQRHGTDAAGRALYDLAEVYKVAQKLAKPPKSPKSSGGNP
jgi:hypothetical protein